MMKLGRQSVIMEIINERDIETQNQLMEALAERGVKSTQATLSRDIRDMRLVKELGPKGNYRYVAASKQDAPDLDARLKKSFKEIRALPTAPALRWTAWRSRAWSARWPATIRLSSP